MLSYALVVGIKYRRRSSELDQEVSLQSRSSAYVIMHPRNHRTEAEVTVESLCDLYYIIGLMARDRSDLAVFDVIWPTECERYNLDHGKAYSSMIKCRQNGICSRY